MSTAYTPKASLRLVVSKLLRAEKLYSSLKQQHSPQQGGYHRVDGGFGSHTVGNSTSGVSKTAHEVQSEQWQLVFGEVRKSLQELLNQPLPAAVIVDRTRAIRERCIALSEVAHGAVEKEIGKLVYNIRAHEFISVASGALHLAKLKARAQAYSAVVEELRALVPGAKRDGLTKGTKLQSTKLQGTTSSELRVIGDRTSHSLAAMSTEAVGETYDSLTANYQQREAALHNQASSRQEITGQESFVGTGNVIEFAPRRVARM